MHVAQWSDVLTHDFLLWIDWMAALTPECDFTLSHIPDARAWYNNQDQTLGG
jgi:hypothetical protein